MAEDPPFTLLLAQAVRGESGAAEAVLPRVYRQLTALAESAMQRERAAHTLQATALVHECWIKLSGDQDPGFACRAEFFRAAAEAMRRILIDHARRRLRQKRGGGQAQVSITLAEPGFEEDPARILALDEGIQRLEESDPRAAEVVRLRFFVGLDVDETAQAMKVSRRTVLREWAYAKARLFRDLGGDAAEPAADA